MKFLVSIIIDNETWVEFYELNGEKYLVGEGIEGKFAYITMLEALEKLKEAVIE